MELKDIKELIDIDHECMDRVVKVHDRKLAMIDAIEKEKKEIADTTWAEVNKKLAETKAELDVKIDKSEVESEEEFIRVSTLLKAKYEENRNKWLKLMFDRCVE